MENIQNCFVQKYTNQIFIFFILLLLYFEKCY